MKTNAYKMIKKENFLKSSGPEVWAKKTEDEKLSNELQQFFDVAHSDSCLKHTCSTNRTKWTTESFSAWAKETAQYYEDQTKDGVLGICRGYALIKNQFDLYAGHLNDDWGFVKELGTDKKEINKAKKQLWNKLDILVGSRTRQTVNRMIAVGNDNRIHKNREKMPASWGTLYELSRLDDMGFMTALHDGRINPSMTRSDAQQLRYPNGTNKVGRPDIKLPNDIQKMCDEQKMKKVAVLYAESEQIDAVFKLLKGMESDGLYVHDIYHPKKVFEANLTALEDLVSGVIQEVFKTQYLTADTYREHELHQQVRREYFYDKKGKLKKTGIKDFVRREDFLEILKNSAIQEEEKQFFSDFDTADELRQFFDENPEASASIKVALKIRVLSKPAKTSVVKKGSVSGKIMKIDNTESEKKVA